MPRLHWYLPILAGLVLSQSACSDFLGFGSDGPLQVRSASPADGAVDASVLDAVTIRFTTSIDPLGLDDAVILQTEGRRVAAEVSLVDDKTVRLAPTDPLDFGSPYDVQVTQALRSTEGEPVQGDASWSFRTRGLPPPTLHRDTLVHHLEALAHDSMAGRWSGSADELKAAHYLADRFAAYGLTTPSGGMIQPFQATSRRGDTLVSSRNVLAAVPGSGALAQEWLVVGAHYDHVGFRGLDDRSGGPNNGADDNGSGTVLVLELARLMAAYVGQQGMAGTPRRSVLFMGFGAEEEGLLGSCHYVFQAPVVPLAVTRAMMNFDMVGRLRNRVLVVSGQETASGWSHLVANANAPELTLFRPASSSAGGTDHACFWQARIPWVGFFTDFHPEYHRQGDDVDLINFEGLQDIGALGFRILTRLMVMPEAPGFVGTPPVLVPAA